MRPEVQFDKQVAIGREIERLFFALRFTLRLDGIDALPHHRQQSLGFPARGLRCPRTAVKTNGLAPSWLEGEVIGRIAKLSADQIISDILDQNIPPKKFHRHSCQPTRCLQWQFVIFISSRQ